jgi:hypothetical protein
MKRAKLSGREAGRALGVTAAALRRRVKAGTLSAERERGRLRYDQGEVALLETVGPRWMTIGLVARALGRCDRTVKLWANSGVLPCERGAGGRRRFRRDVVIRLRKALAGRRRVKRQELRELFREVEANEEGKFPEV